MGFYISSVSFIYIHVCLRSLLSIELCLTTSPPFTLLASLRPYWVAQVRSELDVFDPFGSQEATIHVMNETVSVLSPFWLKEKKELGKITESVENRCRMVVIVGQGSAFPFAAAY